MSVFPYVTDIDAKNCESQGCVPLTDLNHDHYRLKYKKIIDGKHQRVPGTNFLFH